MYIIKPRQKIRFKIRKIDRSYLFLRRFDKFWISSTCNDRKRKLCELFLKFGRKNLWKHFKSWVRDPWVCPWHIFRDYWRSCSIPFPERCRLCNLQTSASYRQCTGVCCNSNWIWVVPSWFSKSKKKSLVLSGAHYITCSWHKKLKLRVLLWYVFLGGSTFDCYQKIY